MKIELIIYLFVFVGYVGLIFYYKYKQVENKKKKHSNDRKKRRNNKKYDLPEEYPKV